MFDFSRIVVTLGVGSDL